MMAPDKKSAVRELKEPEFNESDFPQELIKDGMKAHEKWMLRAIWRLDSKVDWLCRSVVEENTALRVIDVREQEIAENVETRLKMIEEWKIALMGRWGVISIAIVTCVTAVLSSTISLVAEKVFK